MIFNVRTEENSWNYNGTDKVDFIVYGQWEWGTHDIQHWIPFEKKYIWHDSITTSLPPKKVRI